MDLWTCVDFPEGLLHIEARKQIDQDICEYDTPTYIIVMTIFLLRNTQNLMYFVGNNLLLTGREAMPTESNATTESNSKAIFIRIASQ